MLPPLFPVNENRSYPDGSEKRQNPSGSEGAQPESASTQRWTHSLLVVFLPLDFCAILCYQ